MTQPSPSYSILYSSRISGTAATGSAGDVLITDGTTSAQYVLATTANRGTRRSVGVALTGYVAGGSVDIQQLGRLDAAFSGLAAGSVSWVRVSSTGRLERCTPGAGDDVIGKAEADGTVFLDPGKWDSTNYAGGGGGSFTPPTGTGFAHTTGGALDAASKRVDLSTTADVVNTLPVTNGGTGAATFGTAGILHGSGTSAVTCSLIVDADVRSSAAIASSKLAPPGSSTYVIWNNAGAYAADSSLAYDGAGGLSVAACIQIGGGTPATAGYIRGPYNSGALVKVIVFKDSGAADQNFLTYGTGDQWTLGNIAQNTDIYGAHIWALTPADARMFAGSTYFVQDYNTSGVRFSFTTTQNTSGQPIIGDSGSSSPWGVHGRKDVPTANADHTLSASEYAYHCLYFTGANTAARTMTLPAPADDAHGYFKFCVNACSGASSTIVVTIGGVTTTQTLTASGTPGSRSMLVWIDTAGVHVMAAAVASF